MTKRMAGQLLVYLFVPCVAFDIAVLAGVGLGLLPSHNAQRYFGLLIAESALVLIGRKLTYRKPYEQIKKDSSESRLEKTAD